MENEKLTVPYIAYESMLDRLDRRHRWEVAIIIILIVALAVTNIAWIIAWNQYDYVEDDYSVEVDGGDGGVANYIGNEGDINNGTGYGTSEDTDKNTSVR